MSEDGLSPDAVRALLAGHELIMRYLSDTDSGLREILGDDAPAPGPCEPLGRGHQIGRSRDEHLRAARYRPVTP